MDFYIWNKQDSLMGVSANVLLNSRLDFLYDTVLVIYRNNDKENIVMVESASSLKETYDIETDDPMQIGFIVCVVLTQEENETKAFKELEKDRPKEEDSYDPIDKYAKLISDMLMQTKEDDLTPPIADVPLKGSYEDPYCIVTDLSDIDSSVEDKKLTVSIHHAFVSETSDVTELRCLEQATEELKLLSDEIEKHINNDDMDAVEKALSKFEKAKLDILDSCDITLRIEANAIYHYDTAIIIDCVNGQSIIIDKAVFSSIKSNALEYEKHRIDSNEKYKVHYKTVDIELDECCNELRERNNTVFIVSI